jgi:hypothetical protein
MPSQYRKKLKSAAMEQVRVVEAVLRRWDPIGVAPGILGPADEYDTYAPHIASKIVAGTTAHDLALHLGHLRTVVIGMREDESADLKFASELIEALVPSKKSLERTRDQ